MKNLLKSTIISALAFLNMSAPALASAGATTTIRVNVISSVSVKVEEKNGELVAETNTNGKKVETFREVRENGDIIFTTIAYE